MDRLRELKIAGVLLVIGCVHACAQRDDFERAAAEVEDRAGVARGATSGEPIEAADLPTSTAAADSWPRFHGPRGDNLSQETGLLKTWPQQGPRLLWMAKGIGEGYASVSIADGRIYTSGNLRGKTVITALDLAGDLQWQVPGGDAWSTNHEGTRGTPTVDGRRVYHESPLGQIVCLDAKTGKQVWTLNILEEFEAENVTWGLAESLLVDGDRLICCPGGRHASVVALKKNSGKPVWAAKSTGELTGYTTPAVIEHHGLRIILTMNQKALIGVNADSGDLLFRHPHETRYDINVTMPIFHDGQIFITSGYRSGSEMLKLTVSGNAASVRRLWDSKDLDNHHGGVVLVGGYLYGAAHEARGAKRSPWLCLDWNSGATKYAAQGVGKGSLAYADGMLYTLSEDGLVGLVPARPDAHDLIGKFRLPEEGKGPTWAHPVICGRRLYIRHGDVLYAYDVGGK